MPRALTNFGIGTLAMNRVFLGVEKSVCGRAWRDRLDERGNARALAIVQQIGRAHV